MSKSKSITVLTVIGILLIVLGVLGGIGVLVHQKVITLPFSIPYITPTEKIETPEKVSKPLKPEYPVITSMAMGSFEQDNNAENGTEPIEWFALKQEEDKVFLLSKYALDCRQFNPKYAYTTWETSPLRTWLNGDFFETAFSEKEKAKILTTEVIADQNPEFYTDPGNNTVDKIFLLNITEIKEFVRYTAKMECKATPYADSKNLWRRSTGISEGNCWWWLRTTGDCLHCTACVGDEGVINEYGLLIDHQGIAVRPAMWITLKK